MKKIAEVLPGSDGDAIKGLNLLLEKLHVKRGLKDFGFKEEDVDKAAAWYRDIFNFPIIFQQENRLRVLQAGRGSPNACPLCAGKSRAAPEIR